MKIQSLDELSEISPTPPDREPLDGASTTTLCPESKVAALVSSRSFLDHVDTSHQLSVTTFADTVLVVVQVIASDFVQ